MHVFWGPKASTKSTTALYCVANAQQMGKTCLYVDAEKTFDAGYAAKCGVDIDELLLLDQGSNVAEDLLLSILEPVEKGDIDVLVIDSLSSVLQESFFEKPEANPIGIYARSSKFVLAKLLNAMNRSTQVILISHASIDFSGYKPMTTAAIGSAQAHWTSNIIGFKANDGANNFRDDGYRKVAWKIGKSKQPVWPIDGEYYFNGRTARIDNVTEIFNAAVEADIFAKGGGWYTYNEKKYREAQLVEMLTDDEEFLSLALASIKAYDDEFATPMTVDETVEEEDA